jgi:hypothetical protein
VLTASPVAVPDPLEVLDAVEVFAGVVAVAVLFVLATGVVAAAWGWKASTPAVPATVAPRTSGDRRIRR